MPFSWPARYGYCALVTSSGPGAGIDFLKTPDAGCFLPCACHQAGKAGEARSLRLQCAAEVCVSFPCRTHHLCRYCPDDSGFSDAHKPVSRFLHWQKSPRPSKLAVQVIRLTGGGWLGLVLGQTSGIILRYTYFYYASKTSTPVHM